MVAALVIGSAATAVATAPPSFAATCTTSSHCYALTLYGAANGGYAPTNASGGDLYVNCLSVGNQNSAFIDWEIWSDTNDNLGQGNYWVEEGMTAGTVYDSGGSHTGFQWFWADSRPGGGYHEHYIGGASTGTWTNISFYWQGNANWNVYLGGSYVGQSTNNGANSWGGSAGAESTTTNATVNGFLNNYQYKDPNGGWHGVSPNLSFAGSSGWLTGYSTTGTSTGAYTNATSGCGGGLAPATLNADGRYTGQRLSVAAAPTALRRLAGKISGLNGEKAPHGLTYILATRQQAAALMGEKLTGTGAVYVVQLHGLFTGNHSHVPRGHSQPTGDTMLLVVNAATGEITDMGITNEAAPLAQYGRVHALG